MTFKSFAEVVKVAARAKLHEVRPVFVSIYQGGSKNGRCTLKFSGRTGMHGKSRVSSVIKYDCFKLDDSGNCIICRKTWF